MLLCIHYRDKYGKAQSPESRVKILRQFKSIKPPLGRLRRLVCCRYFIVCLLPQLCTVWCFTLGLVLCLYVDNFGHAIICSLSLGVLLLWYAYLFMS